MSLARIVVFPLTFASNVFVAAARAMPGWLQAFVGANPVCLRHLRWERH